MAMSIHRYITASEFARGLAALHAYRGEHVGDGLLQKLEEARLVVPKLRLRWPDPVGRRLWLEHHDGYVLRRPTEPDGTRWEAAVALFNALHRWNHYQAYGLSPHPFDDPEPRFAAFIEQPNAVPFQPWLDMRMDVSNQHHEVLFDNSNFESFYSAWQLLLAAEVADMGVHFRINLAEPDVYRQASEAFDEGRRPGNQASYALLPAHALRDFRKHESALDAVVWYEEESERALMDILKNQGGGRFRLDEAQSLRYHDNKEAAAAAAGSRFHVGIEELVALCQFLSKQWTSWNREGRPLIADAYKDLLTAAVVMARRLGRLTYSEIRDRVGQQGGWFEPILDVIWPDWVKEEKNRAARTFKGVVAREDAYPITPDDIDAFVEFLANNNLEAFFWRLRSFEDHVFRGNDFSLPGMKSDVESMAVVIEQAMRALGGKGDQLYEVFKSLWRAPDVQALLKRNDVAPLARQASLAQDWLGLKARINALREEGEAGKVAADLVLAHRIRGGVHHSLPENDTAELESLFMALMRAAALTFAEVRRNQAVQEKPSGTAITS